MKIKITQTIYIAKPMNKKDSSGRTIPTVTIQRKTKTSIVHV